MISSDPQETAELQAAPPAASEEVRRTYRNLVRWTLWFAGTVFVGIGVLGIFLPLLPTMVFFLMAAWCYARSSQRFHNWLYHNRFFGSYLKDYREGRGITLSSKIFTVAFLWLSILYSVLFATESPIIRAILLVIAIAVTIHIVLVPTRQSG